MIKDYPFASNGKSCMISISAEERPSLKLTIEASSPMDILDIYQDEYGVFFAKYFNSSVEKIEIEGIDAREILYDLKDLRQSAEAERKAKESLHREAIIQGKEPLDIVFRSEGDWKGYVARGVSGKVMYAFNCADLHPKYGYFVREGFEKKRHLRDKSLSQKPGREYTDLIQRRKLLWLQEHGRYMGRKDTDRENHFFRPISMISLMSRTELVSSR